MAAFCTCCGAAITLKSVTCPACGAPSHGMKTKVAEGNKTTQPLSLQTQEPKKLKRQERGCGSCAVA